MCRNVRFNGIAGNVVYAGSLYGILRFNAIPSSADCYVLSFAARMSSRDSRGHNFAAEYDFFYAFAFGYKLVNLYVGERKSVAYAADIVIARLG